MKNINKHLLFLIFILCGVAVTASAEVFNCGHDPDKEGENEYPFDPNVITYLNAKFILVAFPDVDGESSEIPNSFLRSDFEPIIAEMDTLLREQSHGMLRMGDESEFLFPYDNGWDDANPVSESWQADLPVLSYCNSGTDLIPQSYIDHWSGLSGTDISDWWVGTEGYATHLSAEILWKIYKDYYIDNSRTLGSDVDYLFLIFCSNNSPFSDGVGGWGNLYVRVDPVIQDTGDFYQGVGLDGTKFRGTVQAGNNPHSILFKTTHEMGHTFSFMDGPPNFINHPYGLTRYYYGNHNMMCQSFIETHAGPAFGLPWTEKLDWVETVDFTGQNLKDVILYDLRVFDDPIDGVDPSAPKGQIYKFAMEGVEGYNGPNQYFLMAYHSGFGIDGRNSPVNGDPLFNSHGLEIYHCLGVGDALHVADLESAFGLYGNISSQILPDLSVHLAPAGGRLMKKTGLIIMIYGKLQIIYCVTLMRHLRMLEMNLISSG